MARLARVHGPDASSTVNSPNCLWIPLFWHDLLFRDLYCFLHVNAWDRAEGMGGTLSIGAVIAPSGIERKRLFSFLMGEGRYCGQTSVIIALSLTKRTVALSGVLDRKKHIFRATFKDLQPFCKYP